MASMTSMRQYLFILCTVLVTASFLASFLAYNDSYCGELGMVSAVTIIASLVPPMFYGIVPRDSSLRSFVVSCHLMFSLLATVVSAMYLQETRACGGTAFDLQLAAVVLLNLGTVAGHFIGKKSNYEALRS